MRHWLLLTLCAGFHALSGQTLPPYLIDTFPAANATGVPTNVNIVLRARISLPVPPSGSAGYYTLKTAGGAAVSFTSLANSGYFATVLAPAAALSPNTVYTFTVTPGREVGAPYSFSFTTGGSADKTPPRLLSIDPPSGATGIGLAGPFRLQFDRRITRTVQQGQGVTLSALGAVYPVPLSYSLSDDGATLTLRPSVTQNYPAGYVLTVDPTKFVDAFGNTGQGEPVTANYTTFVAIDPSGPHLQASLPADGDTNVPTNVIPRLIFQRSINPDTASKGIELRSGDTVHPISFNSTIDATIAYAGTALGIVPSKPLVPNQTYTIVINSGLTDFQGFSGSQPRTIRFTTGAGPDLVTPAVLAFSPATVTAPPNARILIRTNKPISPLVLDRLSAGGLASGDSGENPAPASATLSNDGTLLTLTPLAPLPAKPLRVRVSELIDTAGAPFYPSGSGGIAFNVTGAEDHEAPVLLAVNPPPGADSVPPSAAIRLRFSEACGTCSFPGVISVLANGNSVPAKLTRDYGLNNDFTVGFGGLSPATAYTVSLTGIMDLAGNPMPDYSFSFTTASGSVALAYPKLIESSLANGDTGVNPSGPFVFTYDTALNPVSSISTVSLTGPTGYQFPVRATVSGSSLTITPTAPLPAGTRFRLSCQVVSLTGGFVLTQIGFTTAAVDDATRPEVSGISPADGAVLPRRSVTFVLTFSKPVDASTVTADSLSIYSAEEHSLLTFVHAEDGRSVSFTLVNLPSSAFTVIASSAIKDVAGNALLPFEAVYQVTSSQAESRSPVREMRPSWGSTGIPANTTITWFLDRPLDLEAVRANVLVLADKAPVPGAFDCSNDGRILRFTPARPFPAGSSISIYERTAVLDLPGYQRDSSFTIAPAPDPVLRYVRSTFTSTGNLDLVFEIEFNQDPPPGQTVSVFTYSSGSGSFVAVPFTESVVRPRVLRLTTTTPRKAGRYSVTLSDKVIGDRYVSATLTSATLGGNANVSAAGPVAGATGVPLNASVRVVFGAPINPLTVTAQSAVVSVGGRALTLQRLFPKDTREILLRPLESLPANTRVDVQLAGLEDLAGRAIPAASWSFTTGAAVDDAAPAVLWTSLPNSPGETARVDSRASVQMVFSEPVDPGIAAQVSAAFGSGGQSNAGAASLSADLCTLTIAPVKTWAKGQQYSIHLGNLTDLSGNIASFNSFLFEVAFDADAARPRLLALSPPDGSAGMPLNARIMAAFDKPVAAPADGIRLTDADGSEVPLVPVKSAVSTLVVFAPQRALRPNSAYRFSISGVADTSGNAMAQAASGSFLTGDSPDYAGPSGVVTVRSPLPTNMPLRARFSEPVSPATLTAQHVKLLAGAAVVPADPVLAADGLSVTLIPREPLAPGKSYTFSLVAVSDFAGNPAQYRVGSGSTVSFTPGDTADTTLPVITFIPADGATGVPTSDLQTQGAVVLRVSFSEAVDLLASTPVLRVTRDGNPVTGSIGVNANGMTFLPSPALEYNATYRMEISGVVDYAGNAAPPASSTFTTNPSADADRAAFRVASIEPADGSAGVPNDSPITITFNKLPATAVPSVLLRSSSGMPLNGTWTGNGLSLKFTPSEPWPSANTISVTLMRQWSSSYFRDLAGMQLDKDYAFRFTTAVRPDSTPLTLVSITPAPGTPLSPVSTTFTLVFSKPVIFGPQSLQAFLGSQAVSLQPYYGKSSRTITATVYVSVPDSVLTLFGGDAIQDDAGSSLAPFSYQYPTLKYDETGPPRVVSVSPGEWATNVAPTTPIKIQFNKAMNTASLPASVRITQDGEEIFGALETLDSDHAVQFTPKVPYQAGSRIDVFVLTTAADPDGLALYQRWQSRFTVAGTAGQTGETLLSVARPGFGGSVVPDAALALVFDHDLAAGSVSEENLWLRAGQRRIAGTATLRDARTIHFQPAEPLDAGEQYVLTAGPGLRSIEGYANEPREFAFRVDPAAPAVRVESVEYTSPRTLRIRFTGAVSDASADRLKVVEADGSAVPVSARFSIDGREWLLSLPSARPVRVLLDGVEDRCGRRLPREDRVPGVAR